MIVLTHSKDCAREVAGREVCTCDVAYTCKYCGELRALPSLKVDHEKVCEMRPAQ